jgi:hypothetical protein
MLLSQWVEGIHGCGLSQKLQLQQVLARAKENNDAAVDQYTV